MQGAFAYVATLERSAALCESATNSVNLPVYLFEHYLSAVLSLSLYVFTLTANSSPSSESEIIVFILRKVDFLKL